MNDGNTGEYKGVTYVAQDADEALGCKGCGAVDIVTGETDLEFCNAMPDCMGCDRRDKRDVVFVEQKGPSLCQHCGSAERLMDVKSKCSSCSIIDQK